MKVSHYSLAVNGSRLSAAMAAAAATTMYSRIIVIVVIEGHAKYPRSIFKRSVVHRIIIYAEKEREREMSFFTEGGPQRNALRLSRRFPGEGSDLPAVSHTRRE